MKKKILFATALSLLFIIVALAVSKSVHKSPTHSVLLEETGFTPQQISIKKGDSIEFKTNRGKPFWPASDLHPTHGIYPEFDPQEPIDMDKSWTFTFNKTGSWHFHDHLNPFYRGTITVK